MRHALLAATVLILPAALPTFTVAAEDACDGPDWPMRPECSPVSRVLEELEPAIGLVGEIRRTVTGLTSGPPSDDMRSHVLPDGTVHTYWSWGVEFLGVPPAWDAGATGEGVDLAVLEWHRFDATHTYYVDAVASCRDLDGLVGGCHSTGTDATHGTHVAGIVHQVAPNARLHLLTLRTAQSLPLPELIQRGIDASALGPDGLAGTQDDAEVVQISISIVHAALGNPPGFGRMLAENHPLRVPGGLVVIAAAGNHGGAVDTVVYPAADPATLAIGAVSKAGPIPGDPGAWMLASSGDGVPRATSDREPGEVDLASPGGSVISTIPGGEWGYGTGTSMAAPHAAGLAALYLSLPPSGISAASALECSATDLALRGKYTTPGRDLSSGAGIPNAQLLTSACLSPHGLEASS